MKIISFLVLLLCIFSIGQGKSTGSSSSSSSQSSSSSSQSQSSQSSSHSHTSSDSDSTTIILPTDENIYYTGRIDTNQPNDYYAFSWSGVEIIATITQTSSIKIVLDSENLGNWNWFDIIINNAIYRPFNVTSTPHSQYNLIGDDTLDPDQTYTIVISKRTEASMGEVKFYGFILDKGGKTLPYTAPSDRVIEFIGDSITCGFGDDAVGPCQFTAQTENNYDTYASIISRELECDMYLEAWSGRGVVKNYGSSTPTSTNGTVPQLYPFTIPTSNIEWDFSLVTPDAVVINLGTNDYSAAPVPTQEQFQDGYIKFINTIKSNYDENNGNLQIFLLCGPMISNPCCQYVQNVSNFVGATYIDLQGILTEPADYGCDGHPSVAGHSKMAAIAAPIIQKTMGW